MAILGETKINGDLQLTGIASGSGVINNVSAGALGWDGSATTVSNLRLVNMNTIAYWNGAYRSTTSNLAYCNKGAFGTIVTKAVGDYLAISGGTLTNQLIIQTTANNSYNEGIRINKSGNNWAGLIIGGNANTTSGTPSSNGGWFVAQNASNQFIVNNVDSSTTNASLWINTDKKVTMNGACNVIGALTQNGTAVSLSGHTHSYLPLSGGTLTGNLAYGKLTLGAPSGSSLQASSILIESSSDSTRKINLGIGSGGENRGLYDEKLGKWIVYASDTGVYLNGTAQNVTGTVAIANGGTGSTTRLGAAKALTNENIGTSATHFCTLTSNWGKFGYSTVADIKTVLGLGTAAYTASTAYAAASHTHNYLSTSGGTVTGNVTISGTNGTNYLQLPSGIKLY